MKAEEFYYAPRTFVSFFILTFFDLLASHFHLLVSLLSQASSWQAHSEVGFLQSFFSSKN